MKYLESKAITALFKGALDRWGVLELVAKREQNSLPKKLKVSHETWRNLINNIPTAEATAYDRLYGIAIEFDNSVPLGRYQPVYD